ncbi:MAG: adenine nucleotide alpha hydrolase family protein [Leptospiraceae bacterium]|nr:adenine nucleotide alpha hydrolase family protein [Leptospiraceae bacterium]
MNSSLFQKIKNKVNRARRDFQMFERSDRLLLAVSGGKDSLVLALVLKALNQPFGVLHIDLGIDPVSNESGRKVRAFCEREGIQYEIVSSQNEQGLQVDHLNTGTKTCAVCGTIKRRIFNAYARQHGYQVLAVAHNLDDEAAMLLANNREWQFDYLQKSLPVLAAQNGFVKRVKPLCYVREADILELAESLQLDVVRSRCSYSQNGSRLKYNSILAHADQLMPGFVNRYYLSFIRQHALVQAIPAPRDTLQPCQICGQSSSAPICRLCRVERGEWARRRIGSP